MKYGKIKAVNFSWKPSSKKARVNPFFYHQSALKKNSDPYFW